MKHLNDMDYKIEQAARLFSNNAVEQVDQSSYSLSEKKKYDRFTGYDMESAFEQGAIWMLNHQWISVDEELPPRNEDITYVAFSEYVLVRINLEGNIIHRTACYDYALKRWTMYDKFVTHWMEIPPTEGGEQ